MGDYDPKPYLRRYGYLGFAEANAGDGASEGEIVKFAIKELQRRFLSRVVEPTGELDEMRRRSSS